MRIGRKNFARSLIAALFFASLVAGLTIRVNGHTDYVAAGGRYFAKDRKKPIEITKDEYEQNAWRDSAVGFATATMLLSLWALAGFEAFIRTSGHKLN